MYIADRLCSLIFRYNEYLENYWYNSLPKRIANTAETRANKRATKIWLSSIIKASLIINFASHVLEQISELLMLCKYKESINYFSTKKRFSLNPHYRLFNKMIFKKKVDKLIANRVTFFKYSQIKNSYKNNFLSV